MPKFRVGWSYEEGGYAIVEAADKLEADEKIMKHLSEEGNTNFDITCDEVDIGHRNYDVIDVEELK